MKNLIRIIYLTLAVLLASTETSWGADFQKVCAEKELPKGFPEDFVYPDSVVFEAQSVGMSGESRETGESYGSNDGYIANFCTKDMIEDVLAWYGEILAEQGYAYQGEYDREHVYMKGSTSISVSAYELVEGFRLVSFNIWTFSN
jgi:hypothetical protein